MSYQEPPVQPPQGNAGAARHQDEQLKALVALLHSPPGNEQLGAQAEALDVEALVKSLPEQPSPLSGEVPGENYLYAGAPEERQQNLVTTTPEVVRDALLRAIETSAQNAMLPFSENKPSEWGHAALQFAQAYLLLDPEVDNEGIPVGPKIAAEAEEGHREHTLNAHADAAAGHLETRANAPFTKKADESGHKEPPRRNLPAAAKRVKEKNKPKSEVLRGAKASRPLPQPRVGS